MVTAAAKQVVLTRKDSILRPPAMTGIPTAVAKQMLQQHQQQQPLQNHKTSNQKQKKVIQKKMKRKNKKANVHSNKSNSSNNENNNDNEDDEDDKNNSNNNNNKTMISAASTLSSLSLSDESSIFSSEKSSSFALPKNDPPSFDNAADIAPAAKDDPFKTFPLYSSEHYKSFNNSACFQMDQPEHTTNAFSVSEKEQHGKKDTSAVQSRLQYVQQQHPQDQPGPLPLESSANASSSTRCAVASNFFSPGPSISKTYNMYSAKGIHCNGTNNDFHSHNKTKIKKKTAMQLEASSCFISSFIPPPPLAGMVKSTPGCLTPETRNMTYMGSDNHGDSCTQHPTIVQQKQEEQHAEDQPIHPSLVARVSSNESCASWSTISSMGPSISKSNNMQSTSSIDRSGIDNGIHRNRNPSNTKSTMKMVPSSCFVSPVSPSVFMMGTPSPPSFEYHHHSSSTGQISPSSSTTTKSRKTSTTSTPRSAGSCCNNNNSSKKNSHGSRALVVSPTQSLRPSLPSARQEIPTEQKQPPAAAPKPRPMMTPTPPNTVHASSSSPSPFYFNPALSVSETAPPRMPRRQRSFDQDDIFLRMPLRQRSLDQPCNPAAADSKTTAHEYLPPQQQRVTSRERCMDGKPVVKVRAKETSIIKKVEGGEGNKHQLPNYLNKTTHNKETTRVQEKIESLDARPQCFSSSSFSSSSSSSSSCSSVTHSILSAEQSLSTFHRGGVFTHSTHGSSTSSSSSASLAAASPARTYESPATPSHSATAVAPASTAGAACSLDYRSCGSFVDSSSPQPPSLYYLRPRRGRRRNTTNKSVRLPQVMAGHKNENESKKHYESSENLEGTTNNNNNNNNNNNKNDDANKNIDHHQSTPSSSFGTKYLPSNAYISKAIHDKVTTTVDKIFNDKADEVDEDNQKNCCLQSSSMPNSNSSTFVRGSGDAICCEAKEDPSISSRIPTPLFQSSPPIISNANAKQELDSKIETIIFSSHSITATTNGIINNDNKNVRSNLSPISFSNKDIADKGKYRPNVCCGREFMESTIQETTLKQDGPGDIVKSKAISPQKMTVVKTTTSTTIPSTKAHRKKLQESSDRSLLSSPSNSCSIDNGKGDGNDSHHGSAIDESSETTPVTSKQRTAQRASSRKTYRSEPFRPTTKAVSLGAN